MKLAVDGQSVFATTGGTHFDPAKPAVIFLHGAGFDRTAWRLQTRWFAHHGRSVLAVDFPGHGWADGAPRASSAARADWTAKLIDAAGLKQAALVGHSMGALVALDCATDQPVVDSRGHEHLAVNAGRLLRRRAPLGVTLHFLPPIDPAGRNRKEIAAAAEAAIAQALHASVAAADPV